MNTPIERTAPVHAPMDQFPVENGQLVIGGRPLTRLATRVGPTPFYAYDRQLLTRRVAELRAALPTSVKLHYAMKANPMPALVCHMTSLVDGIDVASGGELKVALDAGADPVEISFAGPGKQSGELRQAVAAGILINIESFREVGELKQISHETGCPARVAVRVNPDFELKSSGMKMGGGAKQFGVDAEQVPELLAEIGRSGLSFEGFHLFAGSQNLKPEAIVEAQSKSFELALRLAHSAPSPVRFLNLGGGFGIPYFPGEQRLDLAPVGAALARISERASREMPEAKLVIELGRYLVGEAGIYVARIVDRKISSGQTFLIADGGLHHHLSASGNFGQVIRKNYPVVRGNDEITDRSGPSHLFSRALGNRAPLRYSRFLADHSSLDNIIRSRRENYHPWLDAVASVPNCQALFPALPTDCVPYMFPLYIDHPDPHFYWLKHLGVPIWRWDEMANSVCRISHDYRLHLLHLPCHQALTENQMQWMTAALNKTLHHFAKEVH